MPTTLPSPTEDPLAVESPPIIPSSDAQMDPLGPSQSDEMGPDSSMLWGETEGDPVEYAPIRPK
eukprot:3662438-Pleurochrysis_carterae.AAC.1